jgi:hypothetical protein
MSRNNRLKNRIRRSSSWISGRRLRFEGLEDRRLLATLTVGAFGANSENPTSIPVNNGVLTLREAIDYVNQTVNAQPLDAQRINTFGGTQPLGTNDKIIFDSSLNGQTINLASAAGGQIQINREVAIDASMLSGGVTIKAYDPTPTGAETGGSGNRGHPANALIVARWCGGCGRNWWRTADGVGVARGAAKRLGRAARQPWCSCVASRTERRFFILHHNPAGQFSVGRVVRRGPVGNGGARAVCRGGPDGRV